MARAYTRALEAQCRVSTCEVLQAPYIDRLDGVEALLDIGWSTFNRLIRWHDDFSRALEVRFALKEENEHTHWQHTCASGRWIVAV